TGKQPAIGEAWGIGQVRRVEQSHLLTLLATLHVGLHSGLTLLGQQIVVEPLRRVVVAGQYLVLLLDRGAQRHSALVGANLLLQALLIARGLGDDLIVLVNLQTQLANLGRLRP